MITREFNNPRLLELIKTRNGLDLQLDPGLGGEMMVSSDHGFSEWLAGPFTLPAPHDIRVYLAYTDTDSLFVQFIIQDCEGDFLNDNALGLEQYNLKNISIPWEHPYFHTTEGNNT